MRKLMLWLLLMLAAAAPACAEMVISEVMASNGVYVNGEAYDWLELYNTGSKTVDLHIQRLRKKLGWKNEIRTVFRVGGHLCGRAARIRGLLCVHG